MTNPLYEVHTLKLLGRDMAVIHMALSELDVRLRRGLSNSRIEPVTLSQINILREHLAFHESDVTRLREQTKVVI